MGGEMERGANQETPPPLPIHNPKLVSPKKLLGSGDGCGGGDRSKRDEWSEGAVSSLLDAYETKWVLRNRAKLKGQDWEDVARFVSSRANCTKSPKTQTQCKNKIESMKKRYRSESATSDTSSWPLFPRLDLLLRGNGGGGSVQPPTNPPISPEPPKQQEVPLPSASLPLPPLPGPPIPPLVVQNLHDSTNQAPKVSSDCH